ncbi:hypothetical protein BDA96_01G322400 [Sorghum bicolor]|uniref:Uncharacterized protein n=2 Tax=Sorghum bicolor TaxID=4558 RepID=A0A921S493_SORBI|nr:hypothetical protein BDA96_01G322400 [Sorghum bicolor]KXG38916.1 hypothetical protein SORBI_3001G298200 [Sorghum bicolor]
MSVALGEGERKREGRTTVARARVPSSPVPHEWRHHVHLAMSWRRRDRGWRCPCSPWRRRRPTPLSMRAASCARGRVGPWWRSWWRHRRFWLPVHMLPPFSCSAPALPHAASPSAAAMVGIDTVDEDDPPVFGVPAMHLLRLRRLGARPSR